MAFLFKVAFSLFVAAELVTAESSLSNVQKCCNTMRDFYPELVILPSDIGYTEANQRWSVTAELSPLCIAQVTSAADVSSLLKIIVANDCPFAIKSGGHNPWPGVNDINAGVVMDLSAVNDVSISYDRQAVTLGAGDKWGGVYKLLEQYGIMIPGARAAGVGVGGLTLGGGLSYFTPRVGLTANNVLDFEVVLACGDIVHANESNNSDLFFALKGGTSNFGIVTHIDVKAFENGNIWGGEIVSSINVTDDVLHLFSEFVRNSNENVNAAVEVVFNLNTTSGMDRVISIVAETSGNANSSLLQPFKSLEKEVDTLRTTSMSDLSNELQSRLPAGQRYLFATVTFANDLDILHIVHGLSLKVFDGHRDIPEVTWNLVYESLPYYYQDLGQNPIGLNYTKRSHIVAVINPTWLDSAHDEHMAEAARDWVDTIQRETNIRGMASPLELLPYSAPFQDPLGSYGDDNVRFLKEVAKKYDPDEVFQRLAPGDFRVSNAGNGHAPL